MDFGKTIAVWGRNGSGKTTITAGLANLLAAKDALVCVISANTEFSTIQHLLDMEIPLEKSIKTAIKFKGNDLIDKFVIHPKNKNLYVLAVSEYDDCMNDEKVSEEDAKNLYMTVRERFDYILVDCTQNFRDALTFLGIFNADTIIEVVKATLPDYMFRTSYKAFFEEFRFADKAITILNQEDNFVDIKKMEKHLGIQFSYIFPYTKTVRKSESNCELLTAKNIVTTKDKAYVKELDKLTASLLINAESGERSVAE